MQVKYRLAWRDAIEQGGYNRQTDDGRVNGKDEPIKMET
jgi:hypothetical protein